MKYKISIDPELEDIEIPDWVTEGRECEDDRDSAVWDFISDGLAERIMIKEIK